MGQAPCPIFITSSRYNCILWGRGREGCLGNISFTPLSSMVFHVGFITQDRVRTPFIMFDRNQHQIGCRQKGKLGLSA